MITTPPDPHSPPEVLAYLQPVLQVAHDAIEHGMGVADSLAGPQRLETWFPNKCPDPWYWSHTLRCSALDYLSGILCDGFDVCARRMSGIDLIKVPCVVRVYKASGDGPPPPRSATLLKYYSQLCLPLDMPGAANYILDWQIGDGFPVLALSKPSGGWRFWQSRRLEWRSALSFEDGVVKYRGEMEHELLVKDVIDRDDWHAAGGDK